MSPESLTRAYPEYAFGQFTRVDGTVAFFSRVNALLTPEAVVLDVGCGRGRRKDDRSPYRRALADLRGRCARVIGIDVDPDGAENPFVDEFRPMEDPSRWPAEDASVDLVVSDFVLEHVGDPEAYFREARRVLRPGGYFCARTPNALGYVALAARLVPNPLHARVVARVQKGGREDRDVFPTVYRCNRKGTILHTLGRHGFRGCVLRVEAEPSYLQFSSLAYRLGAHLNGLIPPVFRNTLFVFARKLPVSPDRVAGDAKDASR